MLKPILAEQTETDETGIVADSLMLGLDILEYLAAGATPKGVSDIARHMNAPRLQVFRAIKALERLGYVARGTVRGAYVTTSRLYELGLNAPFIQDLLERARPVMQALSEEARQSCNLAVPFGRHLTVVLQTESPGAFSINVPTGYRYDSPSSAPAIACFALTRSPVQAASVLEGVTDLSCPIMDNGTVTAVLTIPYVRTSESLPVDRCSRALQQAAMTLAGDQTATVTRLAVLYG
jgi:hypothetical protein